MAAERTTTAAADVRVATGSARAREGSIRIQRQTIARYATLHSLGIARWPSDHDCIADIEHRQGLPAAMQFIAKGHAQIWPWRICGASRRHTATSCRSSIDSDLSTRAGL